MKRWLTLLMLYGLLVTLADHSIARTLSVGIYRNPPEVDYADKQLPQGIFVDVLEAIARKEHWKLKYVPGTLPEGLARLKDSSLDLMVAVSPTAERREIASFQEEPVLQSWTEVYVGPHSDIRRVFDLAGKRVAVAAGTKQHRALSELARDFAVVPVIVECEDFASAIRAVVRGEADAVATNPFNGRWEARKSGLKDTAITFAPMTIHFAAPLNADPAVLRTIDEDLRDMKRDPQSAYFEALRRWRPEEASFVPSWIMWTLAGAVLLAMLFAVWALTVHVIADRLRRSERMARHYAAGLGHILDHSADVICVLDEDFRYVTVGKSAQLLWGYAPDELLGRSCLEQLPQSVRQTALAALTQVKHGTPIHSLTGQIVRKDGSLAFVHWSAAWSDERREMYCVGRDDSERRHLITNLQDRQNQLVQANEELRQFAHSVSHDLRAPVAAVVGFVGKVLRDERQVLSERGAGLLARAEAAAQRMDQIIGELLRLASVSRQGIRRSVCDVTGMAKEIGRELQESYPGTSYHIEESMTARADRELLRLALTNLIGNAAKYSSRAAHPAVMVGVDVASGEDVFYVSDNGAGFDMNAVGRLFQPFERLHSSAQFEGTGVGLTIVSRVVSRHGGRIWAESAAGKGATFRFTLAPAPTDVAEASQVAERADAHCEAC